MAPLDLLDQRDLQPDQHVNEGLIGDPDKQCAEQIDDVTLLQGAGQRSIALVFGGIAVAQTPLHAFQLDQPQTMQQQPDEQAGPALFAEHFEIGRMIGAPLVGSCANINGRDTSGIFDRPALDHDLVAAKGIEAAAKRVIAGIGQRPFPDSNAG